MIKICQAGIDSGVKGGSSLGRRLICGAIWASAIMQSGEAATVWGNPSRNSHSLTCFPEQYDLKRRAIVTCTNLHSRRH